MKPGDKVRLLHGVEEGIIVGFTGRDTVEVEISSGFVIPVLRRELVLVHREEGLLRRPEPATAPVSPAPRTDQFTQEGVYLAGYVKDAGATEYLLANNSAYAAYITISSGKPGGVRVLAEQRCAPWERAGITASDTGQPQFAGKLLVQILWINLHPGMPRPAIFRQVDMSAGLQRFSRDPLDGSLRSGWLLRLDEEPIKADPGELRSSMMDGPVKTGEIRRPEGRPVRELVVDLHIDVLDPAASELSPAEILDIQLRTFDKKLDEALLQGAASIRFIHGVGSGSLREHIHRRLAKMKHIRYFEDADKVRGGYGATIVHLSQ
jgi:hypothetical protein